MIIGNFIVFGLEKDILIRRSSIIRRICRMVRRAIVIRRIIISRRSDNNWSSSSFSGCFITISSI